MEQLGSDSAFSYSGNRRNADVWLCATDLSRIKLEDAFRLNLIVAQGSPEAVEALALDCSAEPLGSIVWGAAKSIGSRSGVEAIVAARDWKNLTTPCGEKEAA